MRNACDPRSTHEVDEGETDADGWRVEGREKEKVPFLLLLGKVVPPLCPRPSEGEVVRLTRLRRLASS